MFTRGPDGFVRGFLHDFDYASNWKRFLADIHGFEISLNGWHAYTLDEYKKDMAKRNEKLGINTTRTDEGPSVGVDADAYVDDEENEQQSSSGSQPNEQKEPLDVPRTPGGSTDVPRTPGGSTDVPHTPDRSEAKEEQRKEEQKQRTVPSSIPGLCATVLTEAISRVRYTSWPSRFLTSTSKSRTKPGTISSLSTGSSSGSSCGTRDTSAT